MLEAAYGCWHCGYASFLQALTSSVDQSLSLICKRLQTAKAGSGLTARYAFALLVVKTTDSTWPLKLRRVKHGLRSPPFLRGKFGLSTINGTPKRGTAVGIAVNTASAPSRFALP